MSRFLVLKALLLTGGMISTAAFAADQNLDYINKGISVGRKICDVRYNPSAINTTEIFRQGMQLGVELERTGGAAGQLRSNLDKGIEVGEQSCSSTVAPLAIAYYNCKVLMEGRIGYPGQGETPQACEQSARDNCVAQNQGRDFWAGARRLSCVDRGRSPIADVVAQYYIDRRDGRDPYPL